MYIELIKDILQRECANCTKSFGDVRNRKDMEWSTTLVFSKIGVVLPQEDITNFQAISYIYGVPPIRLEDCIKKCLMSTRKENPNEFHTGEGNEKEEDDPLSSFNLALCQACSSTLAELYTVFYKFEKLSNSKSIITTGIQYSREPDNIKFEKGEVGLIDNPDSFNSFNQISNENSQDFLDELEELNSIKEEIDSASECSFNNSNVSIDRNENCDSNYEGNFKNEWDQEQSTSSFGIATRRSTRLIQKGCKKTNLLTRYGSSEKNLPSEDSDSDYNDESNHTAKAAKKKNKSPKITRKHKRAKTTENSKATTSTNDFKKEAFLRYKERVHGLHSLRCISCKVYLSKLQVFKYHHQTRHKLIWKDNPSMKKWMDLCLEKCYNCDICDEFYICKAELIAHLTTHFKSQDTIKEYIAVNKCPPFVCPKCDNSDKCYENWPELQLHGFRAHKVAFKKKSSESNKKSPIISSYNCNICDLPFMQSVYWADHMKQLHHVIGCHICITTFADEQLLLAHIKKEHAIHTSASWKCENCEEEFPNVRSLWMHTFIHNVEDKAKIKIDTLSFEEFAAQRGGSEIETTKDNGNSSIVGEIHPSLKMHQCSKCEKGFKSFYSMQIHQLATTIADFTQLSTQEVTGRDFQCQKCSIDCKRNIILREHCLREHQMIVSTEMYPAEEFLKELMYEKEECNKILALRKAKISKYVRDAICRKCCKVFKTFYSRRIHQIAYTNDISTMEREIWGGVGTSCPRCDLKFADHRQNFNQYLRLKFHCLNAHNLIISKSETELDIFAKQLVDEKDYCRKNQTKEYSRGHISNQSSEESSDGVTKPIPEEEFLEDKFDNSIKLNKKKKIAKKKTSKKEKVVYRCGRCGKNCLYHYMKKYHDLSQKLDISSLEQEVLEEEGHICPRCGIDFSIKKHGLPQLKIHCLEKHNLIVSQGAENLQKFVNDLTNEKKHCNDNACFNQPENNPGNSNGEIKKSDYGKVCRLCGKVCSSIPMKRMHEYVHTLDLTTVTIEYDMPRTSENLCPRCGRVFHSPMALRAHCLEMHNIIISTDKHPGDNFLKYLNKEQELIKQDEQGDSKKFNSTVDTLNDCKEIPECIDGNNKSRENDTVGAETSEGTHFVCDVCGKVMRTKHALNGHKVSHETEKKFVCERCGASFKTANLFRSHKRVHFEKDNGIRPTCDICGKSYISSKALFRHKTNYHPKKPLVCPVCNKTFASKAYAVIHIKKHSAVAK